MMPQVPAKNPKKPKGKIRHKEQVKQHAKIRAKLQADHDAYVAKVKKDHDDFMASNTVPEFELFQNDTDEPLVLDNGAIIAPGYYYVVSEETTFGLSPEEYERNYEVVK